MSLVKLLNLFICLIIIVALFNLFFGTDNKRNFLNLQLENHQLLESNQVLSEENNLLEVGIQSRQKNDAHAEKFAREELNLIYEDEQYISFKESNSDEPQR